MPISIYDATELEGHADGQLYELSPISNRSDPHHKLYWAALGEVVRATGRWPTSEHLHNDLKMLCGYYRTVINHATGGVYYVPDSMAYKAMNQQEFKAFFEAAMIKLAEAVGYDVLSQTPLGYSQPMDT
jgi:hypothetical protein